MSPDPLPDDPVPAPLSPPALPLLPPVDCVELPIATPFSATLPILANVPSLRHTVGTWSARPLTSWHSHVRLEPSAPPADGTSCNTGATFAPVLRVFMTIEPSSAIWMFSQ
ncbi:MAG: hypothetical protein U5K38_06575 [Woeseiaceae bacterium]|nr:hypothetical protein [Woeseiaceae bacterium]